MKIEIRYQSRGGNTKAVAEAIARAAGATAEPVSVPLTGQADVLIIGGGVYGFELDSALIGFLNGLTPDSAKSVAVFSTAGFVKGTGKIAAILKTKGVHICEYALPMKMGFQNYGGKKGGVTLTEKQQLQIDEFAKNVKA